jgi:hypothetical protein
MLDGFNFPGIMRKEAKTNLVISFISWMFTEESILQGYDFYYIQTYILIHTVVEYIYSIYI